MGTLRVPAEELVGDEELTPVVDVVEVAVVFPVEVEVVPLAIVQLCLPSQIDGGLKSPLSTLATMSVQSVTVACPFELKMMVRT